MEFNDEGFAEDVVLQGFGLILADSLCSSFYSSLVMCRTEIRCCCLSRYPPFISFFPSDASWCMVSVDERMFYLRSNERQVKLGRGLPLA